MAVSKRDGWNIDSCDRQGILVAKAIGEREETGGNHNRALFECARVLSLAHPQLIGGNAQVKQHAHARRHRATPLNGGETPGASKALPRDLSHTVAGAILPHTEEVIASATLTGKAITTR